MAKNGSEVHHLERGLHGATKPLMEGSRHCRDSSVYSAHAIENRLGIHLLLDKKPPHRQKYVVRQRLPRIVLGTTRGRHVHEAGHRYDSTERRCRPATDTMIRFLLPIFNAGHYPEAIGLEPQESSSYNAEDRLGARRRNKRTAIHRGWSWADPNIVSRDKYSPQLSTPTIYLGLSGHDAHLHTIDSVVS